MAGVCSILLFQAFFSQWSVRLFVGDEMKKNLGDEQLRIFEKRLRLQADDMRKQIHEELLKSDNEQYVRLAEQVHDSGDESIADLLADVDIIMVDRMISELRLVEGALERIALGSFGICQDCGAEIGYERLDAQPEAIRCIQCQAQHEKTHAGDRHPSM